MYILDPTSIYIYIYIYSKPPSLKKQVLANDKNLREKSNRSVIVI